MAYLRLRIDKGQLVDYIFPLNYNSARGSGSSGGANGGASKGRRGGDRVVSLTPNLELLQYIILC